MSLCDAFLGTLGADPTGFYGDRSPIVAVLLDARRTEVGDRVMAKRTRARRHLATLEEGLGSEVFAEATSRLEGQAAHALDSQDFGHNLWGVNKPCPECGCQGRVFGVVDVDADVDWDVEPIGGGEYASYAVSTWVILFEPRVFACHVCQLTLHGTDELAEAGLPSARQDIDPNDLGEDFDPELAWQLSRQ